MGIQTHENYLSEEEKRKLDLKKMSIESNVRKLQKAVQNKKNGNHQGINKLAFEIENFLGKNGEMSYGFLPLYELSKGLDNHEYISGELLTNVVEGQSHDIMTFGDSLEDVVANIEAARRPILETADILGLEVYGVSAWPDFDPEEGKRNINTISTRYNALIDYFDNLGMNKDTIKTAGGNILIDGIAWEGNTAAIQLNFDVSWEDAPIYKDMMNNLAGLMQTIGNSSPFAGGYLTNLDSTRVRTLQIGSQDVPLQERWRMPGRMHISNVLLTRPSKRYLNHIDNEALEEFRKIEDIPDWLAIYAAQEHNYNNIIVTPSQIQNGKILRPETWDPSGKIKYDMPAMNGGVVIEMRAGLEPTGDPVDEAKRSLASLAFLEHMVNEYKEGGLRPLEPAVARSNLNKAITPGSKNGTLYWHTDSGVENVYVRDIIRDLLPGAREILMRKDYRGHDAAEILNSVANKVGYDMKPDGSIYSIPPQDTPAEAMRIKSLGLQPRLQYGQKLEPDVLKEIVSPHKVLPSYRLNGQYAAL